MLHFSVTCENLHTYKRSRGSEKSEINDPIRLSDFYGLESLSVEFIYMEEIMDTDPCTSEECNNEGSGGGREGKRGEKGLERDLSSRVAARFNPRNSRCVADIDGTCYVRHNRYKG